MKKTTTTTITRDELWRFGALAHMKASWPYANSIGNETLKGQLKATQSSYVHPPQSSSCTLALAVVINALLPLRKGGDDNRRKALDIVSLSRLTVDPDTRRRYKSIADPESEDLNEDRERLVSCGPYV